MTPRVGYDGVVILRNTGEQPVTVDVDAYAYFADAAPPSAAPCVRPLDRVPHGVGRCGHDPAVGLTGGPPVISRAACRPGRPRESE
ncbi:hypothetical protein GCM10010156_72080 [Planobispora rosea]|uniref:Uncharacterized protein n=1 Tax=Planobispora rosea TaxID=35762 RepID=A0A8J3WGT9_PLARO|nr:hypothetical protein GCM10010156_72080 [Planobispora rosea]GIH88773.1 hypothetical protein Pro02_71810 [Planobispora rosea]